MDLAFWLARKTRSEEWFGRDEAVRSYGRETTSSFETGESDGVLRAIYGFEGVDLPAVAVPTLVLNGERESRSVFAHAALVERTVPDARSAVVPDAGHVSSVENPAAFDREVREFLADVAG